MNFRAAKISVPAIAARSTHSARGLGILSSLALFFFFLVASGEWRVSAAQVRIGPFTNSVTLQADTNVLKIIPISGPVANADGSFTTIGLPLRVTPTADGSVTNQLAQNNYLATNAFLGEGIVFRVPLDSGPTVYSMYDLRISGFNTFVTIGGGVTTTNLSFNQVTNALGFAPMSTNQLPGLTNGFITLLEATNVANLKANSSSNSLYSDYTTRIAVLSALSLTNAFATNASGVSYSIGRIYISTNYDALGTALAIGAAGTNYTLAASNALFALHSLSLTNAFATNAAGVSYSGGRAYISTNYDSLGTALAIGSAGTNYTLAASNSLYSALNTAVRGATNGFTPLALTNVAQVLYTNALPALTNGFVDKSITNNAATVSLLNSASNSLVSQITVGGISAPNATNLVNSTSGVIATNGSPTVMKFTTAGTNAIIAIAAPLTNGFVDLTITNSAATKAYAQSLTNGFVDQSITNNAATKAYAQSLTNGFVDLTITNNAATKSYAQSLTNGFVDKSITNNSATVSLLNVASNFLQNAKISATNGFSTNQVVSGGRATNGFTIWDTGIKAFAASSQFNFATPAGTQVDINLSDTGGGQADIEGPQGQSFQFNAAGEIAMQDSGGETVRAGSYGLILQDGNDHQLTLDSTTGNFTLTGGGSFVGDGSQLTGKISSTNGFAKTLTVTNNTALEGSLSFGRDGQSTNITAGPGGTNYLAFNNAGSGIVTNGSFIWTSALNLYTNWLTGCVLTNNTSAWLLQTNGVTLYSLTGTSPIGAYSAVSGSVPAPYSVSTAAIGDHMTFLGYWSVSNQVAQSNALFTNFVAFATNNYIANNQGFGTNGRLYGFRLIFDNPERNNAGSSFGGAQLDFQSAAFGQANTNVASGFGAAILGGATNRIVGDGGGLIVGGTFNTLTGGAGNGDVIVGGSLNTITGSAGISSVDANFLGGGFSNKIQSISIFSVLGGGLNNALQGAYAINLGGQSNTNFADGSVILGGQSNRVTGAWSSAAGRNVTVTHDNVFSWSDGTADSSITNAQHRITATNGLYLNGPLWLNAANTNSGAYVISNQFSLWAVTNHQPNFSTWIGTSNGFAVMILNSNGVPMMQKLWQ